MRQSAVWALGASTLALATVSCGGAAVGGEDAGGDDAQVDVEADGGAVDGQSPDADTEASVQTDAPDEAAAHDARTCDVFIGVDYGAPPCR
jgi:hypothetical protein